MAAKFLISFASIYLVLVVVFITLSNPVFNGECSVLDEKGLDEDVDSESARSKDPQTDHSDASRDKPKQSFFQAKTLLPMIDESTTKSVQELDSEVNLTQTPQTSPQIQPTTTPQANVPNEKTTAGPAIKPPKLGSRVCTDNNYCLNGGTCLLSDSGQMMCLCPEGFYGTRCQTRNICKAIIIDSLSGDQICSKIDRECQKNDKFFSCSCHDDEYFVFKTQPSSESSEQTKDSRGGSNKPMRDQEKISKQNTFSYEKMLTDDQTKRGHDDSHRKFTPATPGYLAECRKLSKCLGVRCRHMSEVCVDGECVCNQEFAYIRDQTDGLCKLINPCLMPQPDGLPICGAAHCVATYDQELYECVCPLGFKALKVGLYKNTTQCAMINDAICEVPLLNKCQHICNVDRTKNTYWCSCLPGYKQGTQVGVDDHMCFFDEHVADPNYEDQDRDVRTPSIEGHKKLEYVYRSYYKQARSNSQDSFFGNTITYDPITTQSSARDSASMAEMDEFTLNNGDADGDLPGKKNIILGEKFIRRELHEVSSRKSSPDLTRTGRFDEMDGYLTAGVRAKVSAQEKCNMYCEENKICVLEQGATDSYRCICDRQGYVSIGDRCLDWCTAAEFSYAVRDSLDICLSGVCRISEPRPSFDELNHGESKVTKQELESSWRPTFECVCSRSSYLIQDPETKLCKLDFRAVIAPCLPGGAGYHDCVEHKNAYCTVLHKPNRVFFKELREFVVLEEGATAAPIRTKVNGQNKEPEKAYTCVCSPEKKFLVDKPRNKARCVDECDLLNIECNRFNRMCRAATIAPDDFGRNNLVRVDPDGVRMNFKRTGCECLPGFNVGPSESVDFTLDDNNPNGFISDSWDVSLPPTATLHGEDSDKPEHLRARYMNINSRCLLDYDVVEFHAGFMAPADFDPRWIKIRNVSQIKANFNPTTRHEQQLVSDQIKPSEGPKQSDWKPLSPCGDSTEGCILEMPDFMNKDIADFHESVVLVAHCDPFLTSLSLVAFQECIKYRYWIVHKLRNHFVDWRRIITRHLSETFDLMEGNVRLRVNKCEASVASMTVSLPETAKERQLSAKRLDETSREVLSGFDQLDFVDQHALIDADIHCELTLHSASDGTSPRYSRKVLLEKQLQKFVRPLKQFGEKYYLMAPDMLIRREAFDHLAEHRKLFNPCRSDYAYCDKQTKCEMVDTVNFTCTCEYGYTPIGSRDIYHDDSRREVCEDINECLFDVCKELANVSTCINEIGDYRCQCNRHYTGDNKRFCTHVCNTIPCKHGKCRLVDDHHAFCECDEGYKETDCSVQDPNVALRKANMIICGSIFTSVLLLAITFAVSLNSQLKKTKKKLKRLETANEAVRLFEFSHQQPFRSRVSKVSSGS